MCRGVAYINGARVGRASSPPDCGSVSVASRPARPAWPLQPPRPRWVPVGRQRTRENIAINEYLP